MRKLKHPAKQITAAHSKEFKTVCLLRNHRNEVHVAVRMPPPEGSIKKLMHYFCKREEKKEKKKKNQRIFMSWSRWLWWWWVEEVEQSLLHQRCLFLTEVQPSKLACYHSAPHIIHDGCAHFVTLPKTEENHFSAGAWNWKPAISITRAIFSSIALCMLTLWKALQHN